MTFVPIPQERPGIPAGALRLWLQVDDATFFVSDFDDALHFFRHIVFISLCDAVIGAHRFCQVSTFRVSSGTTDPLPNWNSTL